MSEYTEQAETFLAKHNLTFTAKFIEHSPYFADEADSRDIYTCTISGKGRGRVSFRFGQSIAASRTSEKPTAYDLLTCIQKSDPGYFEEFCDNYGYEVDSRKAEKTWRAVTREWKKVSRFFTTAEIEELQEIN